MCCSKTEWVIANLISVLSSAKCLVSNYTLTECLTPLSIFGCWVDLTWNGSYTNVFDLHFQGQPSRSRWLDFGFSEILDLANVRIDTKIKSVACIQPGIRKVIQLICVTLSSKVNRQGHIIFLSYLISTTLKMLESTPRSTSYHVYNRR